MKLSHTRPIEARAAGHAFASSAISFLLFIGVSMKTVVSAIMISASIFAGAAHAADETPITRAQVVAELQQARSAGLISHGELDYPPAIASTSSKSRSEVQSELSAAIGAGQISIGESDYPPVAATDGSKTRAQVKAELFDYASSHTGDQIEA